MNVCPRCERIMRNGEMFRAQIVGEYVKVDAEGHELHGYEEEWVEHYSCSPVAWEEKVVVWIRRKYRWLREFIFQAKWGA